MPLPLVAEILAYGIDIFLASDAIAEAPQFRAGWPDFQIKPAAIRQTDRLFAGLGVADFRVRQGHDAGIRELDTRYDTRYFFGWQRTMPIVAG